MPKTSDAPQDDGLGLFLPGNPGYTRHAGTIQKGREFLRSTAKGQDVCRKGFLDGDERIAALTAAMEDDVNDTTHTATHHPWTIKPSEPRKDGSNTKRGKTAQKIDTGVFALWSKRQIRAVFVVLLLVIVCGGHGWRLHQRFHGNPQTSPPTDPGPHPVTPF
ncbi:transmembrane protein, putative [Bodo saltans]|uniref:Transmembrane protein, putative n=1 Tax=Bodo saltans TaxID=75058 RepID=A0A0S4JET0_BODSA|nr:transmembrane protein, putative [Bodo saltans]|eukprot:CUG88624.1 transmembrane protein, putative [Bodo saltans]